MKHAYVKDILDLRTKFHDFYISLDTIDKSRITPAFIYVDGNDHQNELENLKRLVENEFGFKVELNEIWDSDIEEYKFDDLYIFLYDGYEVARFMRKYFPNGFWSDRFMEVEF